MICVNLGIIDSKAYLEEALKHLKEKIVHVSFSIECKSPKITPKIPEIRTSISNLLKISENSVGITATTGENLTEFGKGNGIQVFTVVTVE
jgi:2-C-methyl-D-erythritol 2,4-cyclodiphosphate synthase